MCAIRVEWSVWKWNNRNERGILSKLCWALTAGECDGGGKRESTACRLKGREDKEFANLTGGMESICVIPFFRGNECD